MAEIFVGEVAVGVVPDARGWDTKLRSQLVPASNRIGKDMGQEMTRGIAQDLDVGRAVSVSADKGQADSARAGDKTAGAFATAFRKKLEAALKNLPDAKIGADATDADRKIAEIRARMQELSSKTIGVDLSDEEAKAQLRILEMQLNELKKGATIPIRVDAEKARLEIAKLRHEIESMDQDSGIFDRIAASIGRVAGQSGRMSIMTKAWLAFNLATSVAEPAIAAVTVAVGALGSSLAVAGLGLGAYGAALIPVMSQVQQLTKIQFAAADGAKLTTAQLAELSHLMKTLPQPVQHFANSLVGARNVYKAWADSLAGPVLAPLETGLKAVNPLLQQMYPFVKEAAGALDYLANRMLNVVSGSGGHGFQIFLAKTLPLVRPTIVNLGEAIGNIVAGLGNVVEAFLPFSRGLTHGLVDITQKFQDWSNTLTTHTGFQSIVKMFKEDGPLLGQLLKNLAVLMKNFVAAWAGTSGFGNSRLLLQMLVQFSGILRVLSENPWLTRVVVYLLAFRSAMQKIMPILGPTIALIRGMSSAEFAASAASGIWGTIGGKISSAASSMFEWIKGIKLAVVWQKIVTAAQWLWDAALSANPIGLIIIAIAALVAAFVILWNKSEAFRNFWKAVWRDVLSIVKSVWNWVKDNWPLLLGILTGPIGLAVVYFTKHFDTIHRLWDDLVNFIKSAWKAVTGWLLTSFNPVVNLWHSIWNGLSRFFNSIFSGIQDAFRTLRNWMQTAWNVVNSTWRALWNALKTFFTNWFDAIQNAFRIFRNWMQSAWGVVNTAWRNLWNALKSFFNTTFNALKSAFTNVRNWFQSAWGVVNNAWRAVWNGLKGAWQNFLNGLRSSFTTLRNWLLPIWNGVRDAWRSVWNSIRDVIKAPLKWVIQVVWNPFANLIDRFTSFLHLGRPVPTLDAGGWQSGGRIPGYGGGDIVPAYIRGAGPALLEPGETIVPKGPSREPGFQSWAASRGIPGFAGGGLIGGISGALGGIWDGITKAANWTAQAARSVGQDIASKAKHLVAGVLKATAKPLVNSLMGLLSHIPGAGGEWQNAQAAMPRYVASHFLDWLDKQDAKVSLASGVNPGNLLQVARYLMAHGALRGSAAGIAGTIAGESGGNPESVGSGGFGLIGWTGNTIGLPAGYTGPTGRPAYDMAVQTAGVLGYINANGGMGPINAAAASGGPQQAARVFSARYERPLNLYSDIRPGVVQDIYNKLDAGGIWPSGTRGVNTSGQPEVVLKPEQWNAMYAIGRAAQSTLARGGDGASATAYHAHFDGLTASTIQSEVRSAFRLMEIQHGTRERVGRRR